MEDTKDLNIDDNVIYHIWYELHKGTFKNDIVKTFIENSSNNLTRNEFFSYLLNNKQIHDIHKLVDFLQIKHLHYEIATFASEMDEWYNKNENNR